MAWHQRETIQVWYSNWVARSGLTIHILDASSPTLPTSSKEQAATRWAPLASNLESARNNRPRTKKPKRGETMPVSALHFSASFMHWTWGPCNSLEFSSWIESGPPPASQCAESNNTENCTSMTRSSAWLALPCASRFFHACYHLPAINEKDISSHLFLIFGVCWQGAGMPRPLIGAGLGAN